MLRSPCKFRKLPRAKKKKKKKKEEPITDHVYAKTCPTKQEL